MYEGKISFSSVVPSLSAVLLSLKMPPPSPRPRKMFGIFVVSLSGVNQTFWSLVVFKTKRHYFLPSSYKNCLPVVDCYLLGGKESMSHAQDGILGLIQIVRLASHTFHDSRLMLTGFSVHGKHNLVPRTFTLACVKVLGTRLMVSTHKLQRDVNGNFNKEKLTLGIILY